MDRNNPSFNEFAAGSRPSVPGDFRDFKFHERSQELEVEIHYHVPKGSGLNQLVETTLHSLFQTHRQEWQNQFPAEGNLSELMGWRQEVMEAIWNCLTTDDWADDSRWVRPGQTTRVIVTHIGVLHLDELVISRERETTSVEVNTAAASAQVY